MKPTISKKRLITLISCALISAIFIGIFILYMNPGFFIKTVDEKDLKNIDPNIYFPYNNGTYLEYYLYNSTNKVNNIPFEQYSNYTIDRQVVSYFAPSDYNGFNNGNTLRLSTYSGYNFGNLSNTRTFDMSNSGIIRQSSIDALNIDTNILDLPAAFFRLVPKIEYEDGTIYYLTSVNKTVHTAAGEFTNCVEIIVSNFDKKSRRVYTTISRAPRVGTILIKSGYSIYNQRIIKELKSYSIPDETIPDEVIPYSLFSNFIEDNSSSTYIDSKYNLEIDFPTSWVNNYKVQRNNWSSDTEDTIEIYGTSNEAPLTKLLMISIFKDGYNKDYIKKNTRYTYIGEHMGKSIGYWKASSEDLYILLNRDINGNFYKMTQEVNYIIENIKLK